MWLEYMKGALDGRPQGEFNPPDHLKVVKVKVDPKSGKLAHENNPKAIELWFKEGTEPVETQAAADEVAPDQFFQTLPQ
jgi:membrane carboxypeptidase/penicillin-binding protein